MAQGNKKKNMTIDNSGYFKRIVSHIVNEDKRHQIQNFHVQYFAYVILREFILTKNTELQIMFKLNNTAT